MKVHELIEALAECPPDYDITVILHEMPDQDATTEDLVNDPPQTIAMSAFVHLTTTDDEEKCVYVFGAIPDEDEEDDAEDEDDARYAFNQEKENLTDFQKRQIQAWMDDEHPEDGPHHPLKNREVTTIYLIIKDLIRYDAKQKLFFRQGSEGYKALDHLAGK